MLRATKVFAMVTLTLVRMANDKNDLVVFEG
jgi:hypothetical protein